MEFRTLYDIGDFVRYNDHFGKITDIRIYCNKNNKFNLKYMIKGCGDKWISEDNIMRSNKKEVKQYYNSKIMTTIDDIY